MFDCLMTVHQPHRRSPFTNIYFPFYLQIPVCFIWGGFILLSLFLSSTHTHTWMYPDTDMLLLLDGGCHGNTSLTGFFWGWFTVNIQNLTQEAEEVQTSEKRKATFITEGQLKASRCCSWLYILGGWRMPVLHICIVSWLGDRWLTEANLWRTENPWEQLAADGCRATRENSRKWLLLPNNHSGSNLSINKELYEFNKQDRTGRSP